MLRYVIVWAGWIAIVGTAWLLTWLFSSDRALGPLFQTIAIVSVIVAIAYGGYETYEVYRERKDYEW